MGCEVVGSNPLPLTLTLMDHCGFGRVREIYANMNACQPFRQGQDSIRSASAATVTATGTTTSKATVSYS